MASFFNFLILILGLFLIFILVAGFNRQMMEKNNLRDEKIRKLKEKKSGEKDEIID